MFKNLFNGVSLSALMLRAPDDEGGSDPKAALRAQLAKGNTVPSKVENNGNNDNGKDDDKSASEDDEGEDDENDDGDGEKEEGEGDEEKVEETEEQKKDREAAEKSAAKSKRKEDRVQKRINEIASARDAAQAEVERLKKQLEANPDSKLTAEEVETRAEAIAAQKQADREMKDIQEKFQAACDKLQADAKKVDKDFDAKIADIAADLGPIPSFMIGALEDLENGGEVLAFIANDDEVAEKVYSLKGSPAKMTRELVLISNKLAEAKKAPKKQISKVPDPGTPVKGNRVVSNIITEADTKPGNMDNYVAKRQRMMAEQRKLKGFN